MREHDIEQFIRLEREVWEALANGDGQADGRLLSDDFLGVYNGGLADRRRRPNSPITHGRGLRQHMTATTWSCCYRASSPVRVTTMRGRC